MRTIYVVAAVIREGDSIFATAKGYGPYKGWWEFPGGKIEDGESPEEALTREIWEELNSEIKVLDLIDTVEYDYPEFHLHMQCFWCKLVKGELKLLEAQEGKWLTADTIDSVKWLPSDLSVIEKIKDAIQ